MISTAKNSKKGQIVIPKEIRKVIGLGPGDRVIFTLTKKGALVTKQEGSPFDKYYGFVTTHVVRLKLFRLKAEGLIKARLTYFGGNICFLHQTWLQNTLFPNSLQPSAYPPE